MSQLFTTDSVSTLRSEYWDCTQLVNDPPLLALGREQQDHKVGDENVRRMAPVNHSAIALEHHPGFRPSLTADGLRYVVAR